MPYRENQEANNMELQRGSGWVVYVTLYMSDATGLPYRGTSITRKVRPLKRTPLVGDVQVVRERSFSLQSKTNNSKSLIKTNSSNILKL